MTYSIRKRTASNDTANETNVPVIRTPISSAVNEKPNLTTLRRLAPNITGIARKNVYSAATVLDTPISSAPTIVAPERDVPGKIAAITWKTPMRSAVLYVISDSEFILNVLPLCHLSIIINAIPNTINANATHVGL